jgi:multidrug efflux system membrane fusion protein
MAEQVDQARTAKETAQIALERARQLAAQARQAITSTRPTEAQLDGARAALALAERDLQKTVVRPSRRRGIRKYWSSALHYH